MLVHESMPSGRGRATKEVFLILGEDGFLERGAANIINHNSPVCPFSSQIATG